MSSAMATHLIIMMKTTIQILLIIISQQEIISILSLTQNHSHLILDFQISKMNLYNRRISEILNQLLKSMILLIVIKIMIIKVSIKVCIHQHQLPRETHTSKQQSKCLKRRFRQINGGKVKDNKVSNKILIEGLNL